MQRMDCQSQSQESEILPNNNLTNSFKDRDNQEAQMEQRGLEPLMCLHGLTVSKLNTKKTKKQTNQTRSPSGFGGFLTLQRTFHL